MKNSNTIISIIVATYNPGERLRFCLESILTQKNPFVELIIVDGGSTDDTCQLVESLDGDIDVWSSGKDKGIYDAWNKGLSLASGDWFMFLGADDMLLPASIERYLSEIGKWEFDGEQFDYVHGKNLYVGKDRRILKVLGGECDWDALSKRMKVAHVGSLHHKRIYRKCGEYDLSLKICADYEMLLRFGPSIRLKYIDGLIAEMAAGGVSFSMKAIRETYFIRKKHQSVSFLMNVILLFRDVIGYGVFNMRNRLRM